MIDDYCFILELINKSYVIITQIGFKSQKYQSTYELILLTNMTEYVYVSKFIMLKTVVIYWSLWRVVGTIWRVEKSDNIPAFLKNDHQLYWEDTELIAYICWCTSVTSKGNSWISYPSEYSQDRKIRDYIKMCTVLIPGCQGSCFYSKMTMRVP